MKRTECRGSERDEGGEKSADIGNKIFNQERKLTCLERNRPELREHRTDLK